MIRGIHHVAISTPNLERIVAFYRDIIGAEVVYEGGWQKGSAVIDGIVGLKDSHAKQAMLDTHRMLNSAWYRSNARHVVHVRVVLLCTHC